MAAQNPNDVPMNPHPIRVPDELWAQIKAESVQSGQSVSELVREGMTLALAFKAAMRSETDLGELLPAILESLGRKP